MDDKTIRTIIYKRKNWQNAQFALKKLGKYVGMHLFIYRLVEN